MCFVPWRLQRDRAALGPCVVLSRTRRIAPTLGHAFALTLRLALTVSTTLLQEPYNNIIRTTVEAMAAVMGGTQVAHFLCWPLRCDSSQATHALALASTQRIRVLAWSCSRLVR